MQTTNTLPSIATAQMPAFLMNRAATSQVMAAAMTGLGGSSVLRLVANQGRFRIKDGSTETVLPDLFLDTIIIGALPGVTKTFYMTSYTVGDDKANKQPDCSSLLGDVPDANVPNKQAESCAACPQNAWGSKISNGKEVKACSDYRRVALVSADDPDTVYQANIPPASIKAWGNYIKELRMRGAAVDQVITRISLQEHLWTFNFAGFINEGQFNSISEQQQGTQINDILGLTNRPVALPAPAAPAAPVVPIAAPIQAAPQAVPQPAPAAAAPAKGFGKKNGAGAAPAAPVQAVAPAAPANVQVAAANTGLDGLANELSALLGGSPDL